MPHRVEVAGAGAKDLARLPRSVAARVSVAIEGMADQPRPAGCTMLRPTGPYRIRVGEYRVLYDIDDDARVVTILRVRHRRDAYREL